MPFLDINSYNNPYYFVFEHHIKYAMPYLADSGAVEILNTADSSDYTGYSSLGATDGYIIADSDYGYYYRIWLENVYTLDPLIRDDKEIYMDIGYTNYDGTDGGSSGTGNAGNMWTWTQTPVRLKIHYVDDPEDENFGRAYVELRHDSPESSLARQMFDTLDSYLPNVVSFNFRAVNSEDVAELNAGGENTDNFFLVGRSTIQEFSLRTCDKTSSPESNAVCLSRRIGFVSGTVDSNNRQTVGYSMSALNCGPCFALTLLFIGRVRTLVTDCSRIDKDFCTLKSHEPSSFRIPLVPADLHSKNTYRGTYRMETEIAWSEVELLIIGRIVRNVHLAVFACY